MYYVVCILYTYIIDSTKYIQYTLLSILKGIFNIIHILLYAVNSKHNKRSEVNLQVCFTQFIFILPTYNSRYNSKNRMILNYNIDYIYKF